MSCASPLLHLLTSVMCVRATVTALLMLDHLYLNKRHKLAASQPCPQPAFMFASPSNAFRTKRPHFVRALFAWGQKLGHRIVANIYIYIYRHKQKDVCII